MAMALAGFGLAPSAWAAEFVRDDCRTVVKATETLRFESDAHERWYRRFWTGACDRLPMCMPGSPNWNSIVDTLVAKVGPADRSTLLPKACRLGQQIGLEWGREKRVQKISTKDLRAFKATLDSSGDALKGVEQVEARVRALITQPR
ncbi:hypothetical protein CSW58_12890 [Caulobacter sp. B11]|nr:hypothetical protein CSW58_12890 [Caulobacter sp. B11]